MNAATKLAGFAAVLALVFAVAAFAGDRVDWTPRSSDGKSPSHAEDGGGDEHGAGEEAATASTAETIPGLAVNQDGLTLELDRTSIERGRPTSFSFRIVGKDGAPVRDFDVEQTKRMHLIVVRRDLTGFQHLHPTQDRDGAWRVTLRLPEPGTYRVFADFAIKGEKHTLGADLAVDGPVTARAAGPDLHRDRGRLSRDLRPEREARRQ